MSFESLEEFQRLHGETLPPLVARAAPERWELSLDDFLRALLRAANARIASGELDRERLEPFFASLHVEDLAIAAACERGIQAGWIEFLYRFRPIILAAARTLTRDDAKAEQVADELYAELYGLEERDGSRRSLFRYFHGRSSLATWLRSVVSRTWIDEHRRTRRTESLQGRLADELRVQGASSAPPPEVADAPGLEHFRAALGAALAALAPRDRLRLSYYHVQELTLAATGRVLGEHESTVSRRLEQTRSALRQSVEDTLRHEHGFSEDQIEACCEAAIDAASFDFVKALA